MEAVGPERNARLTALAGAVLLVLLAVEGVTLISLQAMISWHIFVGVLVVPVVLLKMASTGYRFFRYYTRRPDYVRAGPPHVVLRLLGPVVVLSTLVLLGTGLALVALGPGGGITLLLHKASFVIWLGALGIHVLGHLPRVQRALAADIGVRDGVGGSRVRVLLVAASIVAGAIAAVVVLPHGHAWLHVFGGDR
ncbi:MAG TPA: hypothetical protein VGN27_08025 [Gaiellaceae bacterium]|jgi:hypothetical protein|nr:hypothetical protein [Gaiellaceae bacterium]